MTPSAIDPRQKHVDALVGLTFASICHNVRMRNLVAGEFPDGSKFRLSDVEDVWNGALCIDAIDGAGAFRKMAPPAELVVLAEATGGTIDRGWPGMGERWHEIPHLHE